MSAAALGSAGSSLQPSRERTIGVLTSLFPTPQRPREGIFALRRYEALVARGHTVILVQPTPRAPWPLGLLAPRRYGDLAKRPREEWLGSIYIHRPRYTHLPSAPLGNAHRFARAGLRQLAVLESMGQRHNGEPLFDIMIADYAWPAALAAKRSPELRRPFIVSGRGSDILQVAEEPDLRPHLAGALRASAGYCAVSQDLVDAMDELSGARRGVLVPNGVDGERFHPGPAPELPGSGPHVLVVGHLIPRKDPRLALAAFAELRATQLGAHLHFVGAGPEEEALRADCTALDLGASVTFHGEADPDALADLYRAADVLLLCSTREGRPNVVLEALASGLPVVATRAGGTEELLANTPFDVLGERTPSAIADALRATLASAPAPETLRAAVAHLTWQHSTDLLEDLIEAAIARTAAPR